MSPVPFKVPFPCTANAVSSIPFAATLNPLGHERFEACGAGNQPADTVKPNALGELTRRGIATAGARRKSWK